LVVQWQHQSSYPASGGGKAENVPCASGGCSWQMGVEIIGIGCPCNFRKHENDSSIGFLANRSGDFASYPAF